MQNISWTIVGRHNSIDAPIIIDISNGQPTPHPGLMKHLPRLRRNIHKTLASIARQQHRLLIAKLGKVQFDGVQIMPLSDQQILPPIVVVVEKANAPARVQ